VRTAARAGLWAKLSLISAENSAHVWATNLRPGALSRKP
jgi:hypothetical protein